MSGFKRAERKKARLRLAMTGPSGSGKTYSALLMAKGLGGTIAVIDTEHGSASLYAGMAGMPEFDVLELTPPYTPERFVSAIKDAEQGGYSILIIDSITHEWNGSGGVMELTEEIAKARYRGNFWSAFSETTPRHRAFLDTILSSPLHIIATMRTKTETAQVDDGGRKKVVKLGMKSEQRDGAEYEFTTVLGIVHDGHYAVAEKDRTGLFSGADPEVISQQTGERLRQWLEAGGEPPADSSADKRRMLAAIQGAANLDELVVIYDVATKLAKQERDKEFYGQVIAEKDARKAKLTANNTGEETSGEEEYHNA